MNKFEKIIAWMPHTGLYLPNVDNSPEFDTLRRDSLILAIFQYLVWPPLLIKISKPN